MDKLIRATKPSLGAATFENVPAGVLVASTTTTQSFSFPIPTPLYRELFK
ncbi:hypothetical protein Hanom_Chr09g00812301 [Helianthus anomalus]